MITHALTWIVHVSFWSLLLFGPVSKRLNRRTSAIFLTALLVGSWMAGTSFAGFVAVITVVLGIVLILTDPPR